MGHEVRANVHDIKEIRRALQQIVKKFTSGPISAVDGNIATFNGTTGNVVQDGGITLAAVLDHELHVTLLAAGTEVTIT